ncbi:MAG: glycosyltransferase family 2 protein [Alcanivoracaceae bacterium]|nr:glycosyltransferase family 2 protein [Alcanivoracaceae bacterium]
MVDDKSHNSVNDISLGQIISYHKALIKQKEKENQFLQNQLQTLLEEKKAIQKSISYKVGLIITFPFRFMLNLLSSKQNLPKNPIKATCDTALFASNVLEICGWALSDTQIKKIEVFLSGNFVGNAQLGIYRQDVEKAFSRYQYSAKSGFYFRLNKSIFEDSVSLIVHDFNDNVIELEKIIIPSVNGMTLNAQYQIFLQRKELTKEQLLHSFDKCNNLQYQPLISIIVPVYNVSSEWLNLCIKSVLNQYYSNWELCLYDDASTSKETIKCLRLWQEKDSRINIKFGLNNQGISLASNAAIEMAKGDFIGLLDHDDELTKDALYQVVDILNSDRKLDFIYSDEDKIDENGQYCDPHFKSDFNLDALLSHNYICHFSVIRKSIGEESGWFRAGYEGSQDHDLFLRIIRKTNNIYHIPKVLYHWRKIEGSTAIAVSNKDYAQVAAKKAIISYLKAEKIEATVLEGLFTNSFRVKRKLQGKPLVSIIIPFKDKYSLLQTCIESVLSKTDYQNYEILLIDNQSKNNKVLDYSKKLTQQHSNIYLYKFDQPFNYAKLNNWAVRRTKGTLLLFLNNDIEVINRDWLLAMLEQVQGSKVAAVGAKLLFSDNSIQHAGVVVSNIGAVHSNKHLQDGTTGYFERSNYIQNISACTAACLMMKKSVFIEVGGFDEELFKIAYNDVDLCLKIRQAGYLITYTPYAQLYHYESKSRGFDDSPEKSDRFNQEIKNYQQKWGKRYKDGDMYYNPNLSQNSEKISLNIDPSI